MIKVSIIGGGNVAWHLAHVFSKTKGVQLVQVYNRTLSAIEKFEKFTTITDDKDHLAPSDVYIICVSDHAIESISKTLTTNNSLIVHTSGATDLKVLGNHPRTGVFYPLQSFSKNQLLSFSKIPICIEAKEASDVKMLCKLARKISGTVFEITSEQRKKIHLAAVFVNNFTNHLYHIGYQYLEKNNIDPHILYPLIKETALRVDTLKPFDAQTGPAKRKDTSTLENHLKLIEDPKMKALYKYLSKSISDTYE